MAIPQGSKQGWCQGHLDFLPLHLLTAASLTVSPLQTLYLPDIIKVAVPVSLERDTCCECRKVQNPDAEGLLPEFDLARRVGRKIALQKHRRAIVLCVVDVIDFDGSLPRYAMLFG